MRHALTLVTTLVLCALAPTARADLTRLDVRPVSLTYAIYLTATPDDGIDRIERDIRLAPTPDAKAPRGHRIEHIAPDGPYAHAGLAVGDVILTLNGEPYTDGAVAFRTLHTSQLDRIVLHAERDGHAFDVTYIIHRVPPPIDWIRETAPHTYTLDAAGFDAYLADFAALSRATRVVPHREGEAITGLRLAGIRPSTPLGALGLRNGDILHAVNGHPLTSPDKALEAYAAIRRAPEVTLTITRAKAPLTLRYIINRPPPKSP